MIDWKAKIVDTSKIKYNPQKSYTKLVNEIREYIEIYSKNIEGKELTRIIPDEVLTKEEEDILEKLGKRITNICKKYKNGDIDEKEFSKEIGNLFYTEHRSVNLYRILNRNIYDFLEKASEYDFYFSQLRKYK